MASHHTFFVVCVVMALIGGVVGHSSPITLQEELSAPNQLWSFGDNSAHQLGRRTNTNAPGKIVGFHANPVRVAAGDAHVVALTEDGNVFTWGDVRLLARDGPADFPTFLPYFSNSPAVLVSAGASHSIAVTKDNTVVTWGVEDARLGRDGSGDELRPVPMPQGVQGVDIVKVVAGELHTVLLLRDGRVLTFGSRLEGEEGNALGRGEDIMETVDMIQGDLKDKKVVDIAAGRHRTLAMTDHHELYIWGAEDNLSAFPTRLEGFGTARLRQIACGEHHCLALLEAGYLYSWGTNTHFQLGRDDGDPRTPGIINALSRHIILRVFAFGDSSFAITNDGLLFSWGANGMGQLGRPGDGHQIASAHLDASLIGHVAGSRSFAVARVADLCYTRCAPKSRCFDGQCYCDMEMGVTGADPEHCDIPFARAPELCFSGVKQEVPLQGPLPVEQPRITLGDVRALPQGETSETIPSTSPTPSPSVHPILPSPSPQAMSGPLVVVGVSGMERADFDSIGFVEELRQVCHAEHGAFTAIGRIGEGVGIEFKGSEPAGHYEALLLLADAKDPALVSLGILWIRDQNGILHYIQGGPPSPSPSPHPCDPPDCNGNGVCVSGVCQCDDFHTGVDCAQDRCLNDCFNDKGHGECVLGTCNCYQGWTGEDCAQEVKEVPDPVLECPANCSGHGECKQGACECVGSWTGPDCLLLKCANDCSGNGVCNNGTCLCMKDFAGPDCSQLRCLNDCSDHGLCTNGACVCDDGFDGVDCSLKKCLYDCNNHGSCVDGVCHCEEEWTGQFCLLVACPGNCSGHGQCHNGTCVCDYHFEGKSCEAENPRMETIERHVEELHKDKEVTLPVLVIVGYFTGLVILGVLLGAGGVVLAQRMKGERRLLLQQQQQQQQRPAPQGPLSGSQHRFPPDLPMPGTDDRRMRFR